MTKITITIDTHTGKVEQSQELVPVGIGERVLKENAGFKSKICSNCEKIKNDDDFYRNSSQCKECIKAYKMVTRQEKQVPREKGIVVAPSQYMEVFREVVADYMKTLSEDDDRNTKQVTAYEIMCWIEERRKEENEKIERPVQKKKPGKRVSPETKEKVNDAIKQRKEAMDNHLAPVERYRGDIRLEYDKMSKKRKSRIVNQITVQLPRVKILKAIRDEVQKFYIDRRSRGEETNDSASDGKERNTA